MKNSKKSYPLPTTPYSLKEAFTIPELLVVISILSILGVFSLTIFTRTLRGNNKSQIVSVIKENGQQVLDQMTSVIRNADDVVCVSIPDRKTLVVVKDGKYTRFRFDPAEDLTHGIFTYSIGQDHPVWPSTTQQQAEFLISVCTTEDPLGNDDPDGQVAITDTDQKTGVKITEGTFNGTLNGGFKDSVIISFKLSPGASASAAVAGQIDAVTFQTTVQLR